MIRSATAVQVGSSPSASTPQIPLPITAPTMWASTAALRRRRKRPCISLPMTTPWPGISSNPWLRYAKSWKARPRKLPRQCSCSGLAGRPPTPLSTSLTPSFGRRAIGWSARSSIPRARRYQSLVSASCGRLHAGHYMYIDDVSTLETARGNGFADELMRWVIADAKRRQCEGSPPGFRRWKRSGSGTSAVHAEPPADLSPSLLARSRQLTKSAYGIADARVMNDGNRFRRDGRRPHIDLGARRANHGNTNYSRTAATPTPRESAASSCGVAASAPLCAAQLHCAE